MRTTLDIPEVLLKSAQQMLGFKSKTDVIIYALNELMRRKKIEELKKLSGKIKLDLNISQSRRRSTSKRAS